MKRKISFLTALCMAASIAVMASGCLNKKSADPQEILGPVASGRSSLALSVKIASETGAPLVWAKSVSKLVVTIQTLGINYRAEVAVTGMTGKASISDVPPGNNLPVRIDAVDGAGAVLYSASFTETFLAGQITTREVLLAKVYDIFAYFPLVSGDTWYYPTSKRVVRGVAPFGGVSAIEVAWIDYLGNSLKNEYFSKDGDKLSILGAIDYAAGTVTTLSPAISISRFVQANQTIAGTHTVTVLPLSQASAFEAAGSPAASALVFQTQSPKVVRAAGTFSIQSSVVIQGIEDILAPGGAVFGQTLKLTISPGPGGTGRMAFNLSNGVGPVRYLEDPGNGTLAELYVKGYSVSTSGTSGDTSSTTPEDTTPPVASSPAITRGTRTSNSIAISWIKATDNLSPASQLQYKVFYSLGNDISTVNDILANGTPVADWVSDISFSNLTGLSAGTIYFFNLLVRDQVGNMTAYAMGSAATDGGTPPPMPVNITLTPFGGTVVAGWLNGTNTTLRATAGITAGLAAGGQAELLYNGASFNPPVLDTTINTGDISVSFDLGTTIPSQLQALIPAGGALGVKLTNAVGGSTVSDSNSDPTISVDYAIPSPGGAISANSATTDSLFLNWPRATDTITAQSQLKYRVHFSTNSALVADAQAMLANPATASGIALADINSATITGLVAGTTYSLNVLVTDAAGNPAAYAPVTATTAAPSAYFWVDPGAAAGGDGSESKPFQTLAAAVAANNPGLKQIRLLSAAMVTYSETAAISASYAVNIVGGFASIGAASPDPMTPSIVDLSLVSSTTPFVAVKGGNFSNIYFKGSGSGSGIKVGTGPVSLADCKLSDFSTGLDMVLVSPPTNGNASVNRVMFENCGVAAGLANWNNGTVSVSFVQTLQCNKSFTLDRTNATLDNLDLSGTAASGVSSVGIAAIDCQSLSVSRATVNTVSMGVSAVNCPSVSVSDMFVACIGSAPVPNGGLRAVNSSVSLSRCRVKGFTGDGLYLETASGTVLNFGAIPTISGTAPAGSTGIRLKDCGAVTIRNSMTHSCDFGVASANSQPAVDSCIISSSATYGYFEEDAVSTPSALNYNIFSGSSYYLASQGIANTKALFDTFVVPGNTTNQFFDTDQASTIFTDPAGGAFSLKSGSPAIDGGNPSVSMEDAVNHNSAQGGTNTNDAGPMGGPANGFADPSAATTF